MKTYHHKVASHSMYDPAQPETTEKEYQDAQKRIRKIEKFYKDLTQWAGTSVLMMGLNYFLGGGITWSIYPVAIWGLFVLSEVFNILRLMRLQKEWREKQRYHFGGMARYREEDKPASPPEQEKLEDYSDDLLNQQDREIEDLSEYRNLKKPWQDKDLV